MIKLKYEDVITDEHIKCAYQIIKKNTKHREKLLRYEMFYLSNILSIEYLLKEKRYTHGAYNIFLIQEPKYRIIMSENLSDKIVNHLISKYILQPTILPILISSNVATRKNKGSHAALNYFKYYVNKLKKHSSKIYILKCDIKKYFYNIDHEILLNQMKKLVEDQNILKLLENIIKSTDTFKINEKIKNVVNQEIERLQKNANVDKNRIIELNNIPMYKKGKGLPIGNMTSQIFALLYLNDLDHYIKKELNIEYYIRYMDDFLLFHSDKKYLKYCQKKIEEKVKEIKLELNKKTQIYDLSKGIVFVGYRFLLKGKKLYILMSQKNKKKIVKKLNKKQNNKKKYELVKASYKGYIINCQCNSFLYKHKWFKKET